MDLTEIYINYLLNIPHNKMELSEELLWYNIVLITPSGTFKSHPFKEQWEANGIMNDIRITDNLLDRKSSEMNI